VETRLVTVLMDVVAPPYLSSLFLERIESAGTRSDQQNIPRDRGGREYSTTGIVLPHDFASGHLLLVGTTVRPDHSELSDGDQNQ
jgi:hypothetical protein